MENVQLHVLIPAALADALEARRKDGFNISALVRRLLERELARTIVDSEPERRTLESYYRPAVLVSPKAEE
jgi:hypothetical protein